MIFLNHPHDNSLLVKSTRVTSDDSLFTFKKWIQLNTGEFCLCSMREQYSCTSGPKGADTHSERSTSADRIKDRIGP